MIAALEQLLRVRRSGQEVGDALARDAAVGDQFVKMLDHILLVSTGKSVGTQVAGSIPRSSMIAR